jgi:hypothetical protein
MRPDVESGLITHQQSAGLGYRVHGTFRGTLAVILLFAAVAVLPCLWQPFVYTSDVPSHLYNAWLASLSHGGAAPGINVTHASSNVLFDWSASVLLSCLPAQIVEKVLLGSAVLLFYSGALFLVYAANGNVSRWVPPCVAILACGLVFRLGFANFYIACAISFWAIALCLINVRRYGVVAFCLLALAFTAHYLPVMWAVGYCTSLLLLRRLRWKTRLAIGSAAVLAILAARWLVGTFFPVLVVTRRNPLEVTGAAQAGIFGPEYTVVSLLLAAIWVIVAVQRIEAESFGMLLRDPAILGAGMMSILCLVVPDAVMLPMYEGAASILLERVSLLAALSYCVALGRTESAYALTGAIAAAVIFFSFSFIDDGRIAHIDRDFQRVIASIPPGARVLGPAYMSESRINPILHSVDRGCYGHCFSYANYEPSTGQFRVRAAPGSPVVLGTRNDVAAVEVGTYRIKPGDLPVYLIDRCGHDRTRLCAVQAKAGDAVPQLVF